MAQTYQNLSLNRLFCTQNQSKTVFQRPKEQPSFCLGKKSLAQEIAMRTLIIQIYVQIEVKKICNLCLFGRFESLRQKFHLPVIFLKNKTQFQKGSHVQFFRVNFVLLFVSALININKMIEYN